MTDEKQTIDSRMKVLEYRMDQMQVKIKRLAVQSFKFDDYIKKIRKWKYDILKQKQAKE